jgi:hypothetical protein
MTYEQWQAAQELRREHREERREERGERRPGGPRGGENHHDYDEGEME